MRLIDADMADVVIIYDKDNELTQVSAIREYIDRQRAFLDKFPTIDAVPVVKYRECKHYDGKWMCKISGVPSRKPNDFCSYGERKEGADNG